MKDALTPDPPRTDHGNETEPSDDEGMKGALAMPVPAEGEAEAAAAEQPKM